MTQHATEGDVPPVSLGWRLRMALEHGNVSVQRMADNLEVERTTASRWMHDKGTPPKRAFIQQWALATGVDSEWLRTGKGLPSYPDPGGPTEGRQQRARRDSNPQPSDMDPRIAGFATVTSLRLAG